VYLEAVGGTVTAQYAYGNALIRKDGEYPLYDGLGSERTVTNGSQTVTGTLNLDAFGQSVGSTGSSTNPYMYAATSGYRNDGDAGLVHVGARYYDAQVGRFTSRDTVLTEHPYLYCEHDPVNATDPTGHQSVEAQGHLHEEDYFGGAWKVFVAGAAARAAALANARPVGTGLSAAAGWVAATYIWNHRQQIAKWVVGRWEDSNRYREWRGQKVEDAYRRSRESQGLDNLPFD
jgi:RHS repeat-associated protein